MPNQFEMDRLAHRFYAQKEECDTSPIGNIELNECCCIQKPSYTHLTEYPKMHESEVLSVNYSWLNSVNQIF